MHGEGSVKECDFFLSPSPSRPTLGPCREENLTNPMLIAAFSFEIRPKVYREPCSEVG